MYRPVFMDHIVVGEPNSWPQTITVYEDIRRNCLFWGVLPHSVKQFSTREQLTVSNMG